MTRRNCTHYRRAVSLAELLIAMSACTVILSTSAMLIHRVMQTQLKAREFLDDERSALRLSNQFRRDVHQATDADLLEEILDDDAVEATFLRLALPNDHTIEYRHRAARVTRVLTRGKTLVSREEYAFHCAIKLTVQEKASPNRLILSISPPSESVTMPDIPRAAHPSIASMLDSALHVEACLRRDQRFAMASPPQESPE